MAEPIRLIGGRRMQCKDIPADAFLDAVRSSCAETGTANRADVAAHLENYIGPVPWNLFLAKARQLIRAGKLDGCACGCAGDFRVRAQDPSLSSGGNGRRQ